MNRIIRTVEAPAAVDRGKITERPIQAGAQGFLIQIKVDAKDFRGASFTLGAPAAVRDVVIAAPLPYAGNPSLCDKSSVC
jgi:hypothetical protein